MTTADVVLTREGGLMGLLDKLLGVPARKPKLVITDPAALERIERTQRELEARFNTLDQRVRRIEKATGLPPEKENDDA